MQAIVCENFGPPSSLRLKTLPQPTAGAGEVVIEIKAAAVNFPDVLIIQNKYQHKPALPFTPGSEFSGVVHAVGAGVNSLSPGERVAAYVGNGAFAQYIALPASGCIKLPNGLDFDTAAAFTLTYGTAYHALVDRAGLQAGETVLVLGAAGGVGLAAIEIAKALGATVIAAASSDEKLAVCRAHGADHLLNYSRDDLRELVKAYTGGRGPDVVVDPVGGSFTEPAFRSIGWRGRYLIVGFANGEIPKLPLNLPLLKGASVIGVFWGDFVKREPERNEQAIGVLLQWIAAGKLKPHVSRRYALGDTAQALDEMAQRRVTGKVLVMP